WHDEGVPCSTTIPYPGSAETVQIPVATDISRQTCNVEPDTCKLKPGIHEFRTRKRGKRRKKSHSPRTPRLRLSHFSAQLVDAKTKPWHDEKVPYSHDDSKSRQRQRQCRSPLPQAYLDEPATSDRAPVTLNLASTSSACHRHPNLKVQRLP